MEEEGAETREPERAWHELSIRRQSTIIMYHRSRSSEGRHHGGGYRLNQEITEEGGEEDPLQNPRPPERVRSSRCQDSSNLMMQAKRLSCRLSERASLLWGGGGGHVPDQDDPPPPVPRHRTDPVTKYDTVVSDRNHERLLNKKTRSYSCRELLCIVFIPCVIICILGVVCSALVIHHVLGKVGAKLTHLKFSKL